MWLRLNEKRHFNCFKWNMFCCSLSLLDMLKVTYTRLILLLLLLKIKFGITTDTVLQENIIYLATRLNVVLVPSNWPQCAYTDIKQESQINTVHVISTILALEQYVREMYNAKKTVTDVGYWVGFLYDHWHSPSPPKPINKDYLFGNSCLSSLECGKDPAQG